jgi:hypothetical protein
MCWRCVGGDVGDLNPNISGQFPISVEIGQNNEQCMKMYMSFSPHLQLVSTYLSERHLFGARIVEKMECTFFVQYQNFH